jgi:beta-lactamase regulating signal transducer with metallopeptidase domain
VSIYRTGRAFRYTGPVVVLDSARPDAFTTPAPVSRVVVTSGLMRALTRTEQRVVLAHERSHLTHQHVWWTLAADLAAAVNPLLRPVAATVEHAVERWADEDAAVIVGDRMLVARTIARAALLQQGSPALTSSAVGGDVPHRVRAMLGPPPRRRPLVCMALAVLLVAGTVATVAVEQTGDQVFDDAAYHATH